MSKRQFGSIRRLASGRYQARYPDGSGRMVPAHRTFATKTDAGRFLSSVQTDGAGRVPRPEGRKNTLEQWSGEWLALPGKRAASVVRDRQGLGVFLAELGAMPLSAITPKHVQAAVNARAAEVSPSTVKRDSRRCGPC